MQTIQIPPEVIDAIERGIIRAVQDRIDNDPDVTDTYLRISVENNKFKIQVMYLEESNATAPNNDVALLNLMTDLNDCPDHELWIPNNEAIRELAESYSEMLELNYCLN